MIRLLVGAVIGVVVGLGGGYAIWATSDSPWTAHRAAQAVYDAFPEVRQVGCTRVAETDHVWSCSGASDGCKLRWSVIEQAEGYRLSPVTDTTATPGLPDLPKAC